MRLTGEGDFGCTIGAKLKELRIARGLSLEELARRVPLDEATLREIEEEHRKVSANELWSLCDALDAQPSDFYGDGT